MFLSSTPKQSTLGNGSTDPAMGLNHASDAKRALCKTIMTFGVALSFCACTAPGMKLDIKAGAQPTTTQIDGLNVTLRQLRPQSSKPQNSGTSDPSVLGELLAEKLPPYRVGPQDILLVTVWDHPEITLPLGQFRTDAAAGAVVDEEGMLYFPYIGKVPVKGLTVSQIRDMLTTQLSKVLQRPQVDVKVTAYRSQKVYIGGEVKQPAVYAVTDVPFTLAEAVNRSGGFLPTADDSRMILTRGAKSWKLDFHALMQEGNRIGQILLKDGDSLHIPNSLEDPVYMLGELVKPGTLPLIHGNLSLAQALTEVGGIQGGSADARSIYVIRQGRTANAVDVFHLDARNPTAMIMADQFLLSPRDIIYVDAGTLVRYNKVMNMLIPTLNSVTSAGLLTVQAKLWRSSVK